MSLVLDILRFAGQSGLTIYAVMRDQDNKAWNGTAMETFAAANWATYDISLSEQSTSGYYTADIPSALPPGSYHVTYHMGSSPAITDPVVFQATIKWDGSQVATTLIVGSGVATVCNLALSHIGVGVVIVDLQTDVGEEADVLRLLYPKIRNSVFRDFPWPFATISATLALVTADPTTEWDFSYTYPSTCLNIRRIFSGVRNDTADSRVKYRVLGNETSRFIYSDIEDAVIEYTALIEDTTKWPIDFVMALSYRLASAIAPRLAAGDPFKLGLKNLELYLDEIKKAETNSVNEESDERPVDSEFISERE